MKSKTQLISIFCLVLSVFFLFADPAYACFCGKSPTVDIVLEKTPNVVILKFQRIEEPVEKKTFDLKIGRLDMSYTIIGRAVFMVEKVYKGNIKVGDQLFFGIYSPQSSCDRIFNEEDVGTEYLFYLGEKPDASNTWRASSCSRSGELEQTAADLLYIEKFAEMRGRTRLSGSLMQTSKYLAGRKVYISGNGTNIELKTDPNGVYEIYDLPAGMYTIVPEKIDGYKISSRVNGTNIFSRTEEDNADPDSVLVQLKAESHTEANFDFSIENQVSGRFFDTNGKTLQDVCLQLSPLSKCQKSKREKL